MEGDSFSDRKNSFYFSLESPYAKHSSTTLIDLKHCDINLSMSHSGSTLSVSVFLLSLAAVCQMSMMR